ncbi:hypothetical protein ACFQ1M_15495 [Sungkyunkwania multivorans]|uniref:Uncharacterized protein n=1 Tax=Sungkyunkwania multivorans TaxID=1173618 RepID=A0ABW3D171_9FLAO
MKKKIVLISLFILPVVIYLFFASGIYHFGELPVLTEKVGDLEAFSTEDGQKVKLDEKITVLGFLGNDFSTKKSSVYNLHEEIYKGNYDYDTNFQMVMVLPKDTESQVADLKLELSRYAKIDKWRFVYGDDFEIKELFQSLQTPFSLNSDLGSDYVFIIDKKSSLRGRLPDEENDKIYGYNANLVSELHNLMDDDVKVVLAEYNLALKKNYKVSRRDSFLKQKKK